MQGPGSLNNVVANTVVVYGSNGGEFIYSGTPALGNPPIAWSADATTDPYGNVLPADITIGTKDNANGQYSGLYAGGAYFWPASGDVAGGDIVAGNAGQLQIDSPQTTASDTQATLQLVSQLSPSNPFGVPVLYLENPTILWMPLGAVGPITAIDPNNANVSESWHPLTLVAGFSAGNPGPQYKLFPDGTVHLTGIVDLTAAQAAGTAFATLPSGYVPATTQHFVTGNNLSGYVAGERTIYVNSGGNVGISPSGSTNDFVDLDGSVIELDA